MSSLGVHFIICILFSPFYPTIFRTNNISDVTTTTTNAPVILMRLIPNPGSYTPRHCTARQRVALIIPCRDREEHLRVFLNRLNTVLQRQQISYQIFVVEQVGAIGGC